MRAFVPQLTPPSRTEAVRPSSHARRVGAKLSRSGRPAVHHAL